LDNANGRGFRSIHKLHKSIGWKLNGGLEKKRDAKLTAEYEARNRALDKQAMSKV